MPKQHISPASSAWSGKLPAAVAFAGTIFAAAFLLFLVQPLICKYILPWFGGSSSVWTTCMLFFQVMLFAGYACAHLSSRWLKPRAAVALHLGLVGVALIALPIVSADSSKPDGGGNPTWQILALLTGSIGVPFFVLSSTSPLFQSWCGEVIPGAVPFRLYALSSAGSLLALLGFPFFLETRFTRSGQARLWGWGFGVYALGCLACAIMLWRAAPVKNSPRAGVRDRAASPATLWQKAFWFLLPACASILLLATTNKICQEVAVIPLLWVLPLSLYLLTFVICFDNPRWYRRLPFGLALCVALGGICWVLIQGTRASIPLQIGIYCAGLFICCMVCHGELYRLKPNPRHLTGFYLAIAAGGALGSLFVAVVAPLIFTAYFELHWGLMLCGLLFLLLCASPRENRRPIWMTGLLAAALLALGFALWGQAHKLENVMVQRTRNFYGVLTVVKDGSSQSNSLRLELVHGRTMHGLQFLDPRRALLPPFTTARAAGWAWPCARCRKGRAESESWAWASARWRPMRDRETISIFMKSTRRCKSWRSLPSPTFSIAWGKWR
ncbi:MAG TPA: hypothetical protein VFC44_11955 [Candidatus Saccharimonadales bacterium]|nr:hypothetical protein [Candidatus Saccharimonadales bacterium]